MAAGVEDAGLDLGEGEGGEADGVGVGLAVDEELGKRRLQHPLGVAGGGLDEVAEHVVVADLQGIDAALADVLALQLGDDAAALVAQAAGFVELLVEARGDEFAVAGEERRFVDQRLAETSDEGGMAAEGVAGGGEDLRNVAVKGLAQALGLGEAVAEGGEVAGAAAVEREAREGALEVGDAAEEVAGRAGDGGFGVEVGDGALAGADEAGVGRRGVEAGLEQAGTAAGQRAVDGGEERALAAAGHGAGELEVAAGGGVDLHQAAGALADRRAQERQAAALGELEVVDDGAEGGDLGAVEGGEAVEGLDFVDAGDAGGGGAGVEARAGERGGDGARTRRRGRGGRSRRLRRRAPRGGPGGRASVRA